MPIFQRFLKSQLGMTMMEMVVVGGIGTIAALGAASLMGGLSGSSREAEMIVEKTQFASSLGVYLNSSSGCGDVKNAPLGGKSWSSVNQDIALDNWKFRGIQVWEKNTKFSDKYKEDLIIKEMQGRIEMAPGLPTVTMSYINDTGTMVTEDLTKTMLKFRVVIAMSGRDYPHEYTIPVLATSTMELRFCGDSSSMAQTCGELGGKFDPITGECKLKDTCTVQGSFVKLTCVPLIGNPPGCDTSRGTNTNNPVTGGQTCPYPSIPVATGGENWTVQKDCGKKCTVDVNNSLGYFTCMHCPL